MKGVIIVANDRTCVHYDECGLDICLTMEGLKCQDYEKKSKPILFNTEMVKAILEGRKTQTRRIVKPKYSGSTFEYKEEYEVLFECEPPTEPIKLENGTTQHKVRRFVEVEAPYAVGDTLWVRETWADLRGMGFDTPFSYLANNLNKHGQEDGNSKRCRLDYGVKWRPSIHMPRSAARLFLKVTDVRYERLQDITEDGATAEGALGVFPPSKRWRDKKSKWVSGHCSECSKFDLSTGLAIGPCSGKYEGQESRDGSSIGCTFGFSIKSDTVFEPSTYRFKYLWNSLADKPGAWWSDNPWVWVIDFERMV